MYTIKPSPPSNHAKHRVCDQPATVVGSNGTGKYTPLSHLSGCPRGKKKIETDGTKLLDETLPRIRRRVGLVFRGPNDRLFCPTVFDDVAFGPIC